MALCLVVAFGASSVIRALLLPVSLVLLPGRSEWWALSPCLGSPESQAPPLLGEGKVEEEGPSHAGASAMSGVVRFAGFAAVGRGMETVVMGASETGGVRSQAPLILLPSCLWVWVQLLQSEGWDLRHCLCFSLASTSSVCSSPPTFKCPDVWNFPVPVELGRDSFVALWMFYWL